MGPLGPDDETQLRDILEQHLAEAGSHRTAALLDDWQHARSRFHKLTPKPL
jgi:glutamate synthase (NADPH/NADH) large chain